MTTRHGRFASPLGELLLVASDDAGETHEAGTVGSAPGADAITGIYFADHRYPPAADEIGEDLGTEPDDALLMHAATQLREYLAGERQLFNLPLAVGGDDFSQQVWQILCATPYGGTISYGEIATSLGNRALAQRVGQSVGHNPVSIVVPCHRVLGADGSLTGYAGGLDRKRFLLELEEPDAADAGRLF